MGPRENVAENRSAEYSSDVPRAHPRGGRWTAAIGAHNPAGPYGLPSHMNAVAIEPFKSGSIQERYAGGRGRFSHTLVQQRAVQPIATPRGNRLETEASPSTKRIP